jgi:thiol:disulfide interchange protein DsbD
MIRLVAVTLFTAALLCAQARNPVAWTIDTSSSMVKVQATMDPGWHIYALTSPAGGPTPTTIKLGETKAAAGIELYQPKPEVKFDPNFNMNVEAFEGSVTFLAHIVPAEGAKGPAEIPLLVRYQACTDKECLPRKLTLTAKLDLDPDRAKTQALPAGYTAFTGQTSPALATPPAPAQNEANSEGLGRFLLVAFGFGLAAIFTPCVFPMIPITLSFFLNKPGALRQAILFCLGIVFMFTAMGLLVTAALGPFGVVQLGSNPWVNGFIALVFIVFGLSLLGAFEITLPSSLLTKMDQASQRGGSVGTLLMGLTFSLTSFACVGPFIGTLLASSVQRGGIQPALGMMSFATGLASPFFLLALFPAFLQRMPRSGGWLARVKVVLGFIILAASVKYLSSIDQVLQWNILTRDRFLAAWIVLFALPGLYLLGFLRMEGIRHDETVGVGRTLAGAAFLIFAISLIPGMFGSPLGELDAMVPLAPETASGIGPGGGSRAGLSWMKNDLQGALTRAKAENKRVLVAFTGYACTNCHWMKANMFTKPDVAAAMADFVLVELYTDGTDAASDTNQQLQESRFQTVAIPYYAVFDEDQRVVSTFAGLTRNTNEFLAFLRKT